MCGVAGSGSQLGGGGDGGANTNRRLGLPSGGVTPAAAAASGPERAVGELEGTFVENSQGSKNLVRSPPDSFSAAAMKSAVDREVPLLSCDQFLRSWKKWPSPIVRRRACSTTAPP